jgi:beta-barrel assembly-enhancing protease
MKNLIAFGIVTLLLVTAIVRGEMTQARAPVGPQAIIHFVADTEYELTHLPMSLARLPDEEEVRIGNRLATEQGAHTPVAPQDRATEAYIAAVGKRLARHAHRKLPYQFHYIPRKWFVNAYALPGGHVYLGAGLLELMDTEDELAAVLGHEIEHIDHYHCAERAETEALLRRIPLGQIVGIPIEVFEAGYSKDQELQADREGTALAAGAGYSPRGAVRVFEQLEKLEEKYMHKEARAQTPMDEAARLAQQTVEQYFMSHPPASERIDQINRLIRASGWEQRNEEKPLELPSRPEAESISSRMPQ